MPRENILAVKRRYRRVAVDSAPIESPTGPVALFRSAAFPRTVAPRRQGFTKRRVDERPISGRAAALTRTRNRPAPGRVFACYAEISP